MTPRTPHMSLVEALLIAGANPMTVLDERRRIVASNPAFTAQFGYDLADLRGQSSEVFLAPSGWEAALADWRAVLSGEAVFGARELVSTEGQATFVPFAARHAISGGQSFVLFAIVEGEGAGRASGWSQRALERLTPREREVIAGIARGQRAREIGEALFISPTTVRTHIRNAVAKLGARSQAHLLALALTTGADLPRAQHRQK